MSPVPVRSAVPEGQDRSSHATLAVSGVGFNASGALPVLETGRQAAGALLHHDAITGTAADYVVQW